MREKTTSTTPKTFSNFILKHLLEETTNGWILAARIIDESPGGHAFRL
jgi:hypothetical protein